MATDNKINATNSWNFALIDYFHDMSLLKEGDGVNFQKASCTLDGCVKIYTSRVDSVATETGKLLSGLADSGNKRRKDDDQEDEDGEDGEEDENGERKKSRKKVSILAVTKKISADNSTKTDITISRINACAELQLPPTQEVRTRILGRSTVQKSLRRLRRRWRQGLAAQPSGHRRHGTHRL